MAKKRRGKRGLFKKVDDMVEFLIYESTGGTIGKLPAHAKLAPDGTLPINPIPFHTRAKFADSAMKYVNGQVPAESDDEEDGIADFRKRLEDDSDSRTPEHRDGSGED